jgi:hypothetical protein
LLLSPFPLSDYEERVDFARLRVHRMGRARAALEASKCGAFLLFNFYNIRRRRTGGRGSSGSAAPSPPRPG